jgi:Rrf2 family iron-sulfur cluster assembly transcriptional regulator
MMRMSTKGHHAIRILIYLTNEPDRPVNKVEIGETQGISTGYVQQLMLRLTSAGLVRSHRGKDGGFSLSRPAADITVRQVLEATEGSFELAPCVNPKQCCIRTPVCPAHPLWIQASNYVNDLFDGTTIADLAATGHTLEEEQQRQDA